jgi:hypothetical protein
MKDPASATTMIAYMCPVTVNMDMMQIMQYYFMLQDSS